MMAASRIGSKRAVSETMRSLLESKDEFGKLGVKLLPNGAGVKRLYVRGDWGSTVKRVLDIFLYGNVMLWHGTSGDNFGRL
jgi:hypothetical protein